jgi:ABC-2 type transport system ATP-binding protein
MIEVEALRKNYGHVAAVDGVTFTAPAGAIFGLLGPNGAGKSTTIHCLSGLQKPTGGSVRILGHDVVSDGIASRRQLGVVPQEVALYEDLSAHDNLSYWGAAWGLAGADLRRRVGEVLDRVGLADRARDAVKTLSGGMKRRLNFGCGVVHRPKVLLLDEPTVGVDPQSRVRLLELVREEAAAGACVLYTTHYMEEAESLCHRIGIVDHGRLIALGTLAELRAIIGERDILRLAGRFDAARVTESLRATEGGGSIEVAQADAANLTLVLPEASRRLPAVFAALEKAGAEVRETTLTQPSLESLFIKMTGKELRE